MTTTFFPPFGDNRLENAVNFAVNSNPVAFAARAFFLTAPEALVTPLGILGDLVLARARLPDNLFLPDRTVSLPLQVGDRVSSPSRQVAGSELFGAYIIAMVPGTDFSINVWDVFFITTDPLSDLQPQSLRALQ